MKKNAAPKMPPHLRTRRLHFTKGVQGLQFPLEFGTVVPKRYIECLLGARACPQHQRCCCSLPPLLGRLVFGLVYIPVQTAVVFSVTHICWLEGQKKRAPIRIERMMTSRCKCHKTARTHEHPLLLLLLMPITTCRPWF